ncbi:MAG: hypothetical protein OWR52_08850 [Acidibacillus sp.]|nr:hypothetical protein [Acidibacillus sp.]
MSELYGGIHLGPFTLYYSWLGTFLFVLVTVFTAKWYARKQHVEEVDDFIDVFIASCTMWLVVWKVSGMLFVLHDLFRVPAKVLFAAPTAASGMIATAVVILYIGYSIWRGHLVMSRMFDLMVVSFTAGFIPYSLFHLQLGQQMPRPFGIAMEGGQFAPVNVYEVIILCVNIVLLWSALRTRGTTVSKSVIGFYVVALDSIGSLFVSLFSNHDVLWGFLSPGQWGLLALACVGLWGMTHDRVAS